MDNQTISQENLNDSLNNQFIQTQRPLNQTQFQLQHQPQSGNYLKLFIGLFFLLTFFLIFFSSFLYFFVVEPKIKLNKYSKNIIEKLPKFVSKISEIDQSINRIYISITQGNQNLQNPNLLLRLDTRQFAEELKKINNNINNGQVAGASINTPLVQFYSFTEKISKLTNELKKSSTFGDAPKSVLGEQTVEPTLITSLREIKDISNQVIEFSSEGKTQLEDLKNTLKNRPLKNDQLNRILTEIENLNNDAFRYLNECEKIADYYYKILDIRIELIPFLASYIALIQEISQTSTPDIYLNRIEELENTIKKLHSDIIAFKEEDLPTGINTLHQDNIKTLKLLKDNVIEIKSSVILKNYSSFLTAILTLGQNVEPLSTRAVSLEISFWQNNKTLNEGKRLHRAYEQVKKELESLIQNNKIPLILTYQTIK